MKSWLNRTIGRQIMSAFYMIILTLVLTSGGVYFYTTVCQIKCNTSSVKTSYAVFQLRHFR
ncbi:MULTISPECIES: hypothetical protein, partial [Exiguobacterium]|uniref:hypothetical protein n=1 Tax=Exiguobacterium TaxID=33986 RepID=UPI001BE872E4